MTTARSATSLTWSMAWEMTITAWPASRSRTTRSSTRRDSRMPSAAVGSSRMTTRELNAAARATATACRWPPDMRPTDDRLVRQLDLQPLQHLPGRVGHLAGAQEAQAARQPARAGQLTPGVEVGRRPEVVEEREVLVDGLDAVGAGVGGRAHLHGPAVELDDAAHPGDARR